MFLATSYWTIAQFKAAPNDFDLSGYTDAQLQTILQAASGYADAIMRRSFRAQEETKRYVGGGTSTVDLEEEPVLYVKRVQIALPGTQGLIFPSNQLLVDSEAGSILDYTPLYWQGILGYVFPRNVPVDCTFAWGRGYSWAQVPKVAIVDTSGGSLTPGTYNLAITAKTFYGETAGVVQAYTTAAGAFIVTPKLGLGVYVYRAYASPATNNTTISSSPAPGSSTFASTSQAGMNVGDQWLLGAGATAEVVTIAGIAGSTITTVAPLTYAHNAGEAFILAPLLVGESPFVAYGGQTIQILVTSLQPPANFWQDVIPTVDASAPPHHDGVLEAVRLLALSRIAEQNSLANRGIYSQGEGDKRLMWRSSAGLSGKGSPVLVEMARDMLTPYSLNRLYIG